jgi:hypothetical protein
MDDVERRQKGRRGVLRIDPQPRGPGVQLIERRLRLWLMEQIDMDPRAAAGVG